MRSRLVAAAAAILVIGLIVAGLIYFVFWNQFVPIAAMGINYARYMNAPAGTIATEANAAWKGAEAQGAAPAAPSPAPSEDDWPSYNKTLTSNRFSDLNQINRQQRGQAQGSLHLRYQAVHGIQFRPHRGERRAYLRHGISTCSRSTPRPARKTGGRMRITRQLRRRASIAAQPISTECCSAARRTPACSPMISRPASASGKRRSATTRRARARRPRRSPGTASSSSATPAAT